MSTHRHLHTPRLGRARARRGEGDRLRIELLDAAEELLLEKGRVEAVSIRDVTRRVGCSPPAIYLHFDSKDDLFLATCSRRADQFTERVMTALAGEGSVVDRLTAVAHAYIAYGLENPSHYRVLFASGPILGASEAEEAEGFLPLVVAVAAGMESGELAPGDPMATALSLWAAVHGIVMLLLDKPDLDDVVDLPDVDVLIDTVVTMCMEGIAA